MSGRSDGGADGAGWGGGGGGIGGAGGGVLPEFVAIHFRGCPIGTGVCERARDFGARADDFKRVVLAPNVEEMDGRGLAKLGFDRPDVKVVVGAKHIEEELRGRDDRLGGFACVPAAEQAEVGDGLQLEEIGTCEHEEIAKHGVGIPVSGQVGEAVEDVTYFEAGGSDDVSYPVNKYFESFVGAERDCLAGEVFRKQAGVVGEAKVDEPPSVAHRGVGEGGDECLVLGHVAHVPHDIVARQNAREGSVESGKPRGKGLAGQGGGGGREEMVWD